MFTGIITQVGSVRSVARGAASMTLEVACTYPKIELGESIAVNGVCLTVVEVRSGAFVANLSAETLARSTFDRVKPGLAVNLERALAVSDRLGGHIVAGHVDGVGRVVSKEPVDDAQRWRFEAPPEVHRYVAEKGSIAIDGVSLTVNHVGPTTFDVMLVPFTLSATTLGRLGAGDPVNLEADVLARYVARALEHRDTPAPTSGVTLDLLEKAGFLDPKR
jgi:riboflavin synthase